jgi:dolichol-phosphate mannosyltransferase
MSMASQSVSERPQQAEPAPALAPVPELDIVVPTFCERDNIPLVIGKIAAALKGIAWGVIFVDDDSPDGTAALAKAIGEHDPRVRCIRRIGRRGLMGACIEGMLASQAPYVAVMDADLQHDERLLAEMLARLRADAADIVVGSRYLDGAGGSGMSARRAAASRFAGSLTRRLLGITTSDPMSGFFAIRRAVFDEIAPRLATQGFKILADILSSADSHIRVLDLPYAFRSRQHGTSKLDSKVILDFADVLLTRAVGNLIPARFPYFMIVGGIGVAVHLVALRAILTLTDAAFLAAQTVATIAAIAGNFFLNNLLTYRDQRLHGLALIRGLLVFYGICFVGALSNIGVANWIYANRSSWWLAGLLGSLVGLVWNFALSSTFVWRAR